MFYKKTAVFFGEKRKIPFGFSGALPRIPKRLLDIRTSLQERAALFAGKNQGEDRLVLPCRLFALLPRLSLKALRRLSQSGQRRSSYTPAALSAQMASLTEARSSR